MAVPVLQKDFLNIIPDFRGDVEQLPRFISVGDKLVGRFYNAQDPADFQNEYLLCSLMAKIKDDAQIQISNCVINSWQDLKTALLATYADKRDIFTLTIELTQLSQKSSESSFDFYNRIMQNLNLQSAYIATKVQADSRATMQSFARDLGLRVLLRGLREPVGPLMRTRDPKNLSDALNILTNDFQIDSLTGRNHTLPNTQKRPDMKFTYKQQNFSNKFNQQPSTSHASNQNTGNTFQRQGNQQNPNWNRNFQTKNNFNNNSNSTNWRQPQTSSGNQRQNVWNKTETNLPKPTAMSAQTLRSNLHNLEMNPVQTEDDFNPSVSEEERQVQEEYDEDDNFHNQDFRCEASGTLEYYST